MSMKKDKNSSYLIYNIVSLGKIAGKRFHAGKLNMNLQSNVLKV